MRGFLLALALLASPAWAQDAVTYPYDGSFEDASFAVENAIINKGLVIDNVSHVGDMLNRTAADVGPEDGLKIKNANVFSFCSAVVSREAMVADPMNVVFCPYGIFVMDAGEGVVVGHRNYPEGAMKKVQAFLAEIAQEAIAQ